MLDCLFYKSNKLKTKPKKSSNKTAFLEFILEISYQNFHNLRQIIDDHLDI